MLLSCLDDEPDNAVNVSAAGGGGDDEQGGGGGDEDGRPTSSTVRTCLMLLACLDDDKEEDDDRNCWRWFLAITDTLDGCVARDAGQHVPLVCPVLALPVPGVWLLLEWSGCSPMLLVLPELLLAEHEAVGGHLLTVPVLVLPLLPILPEPEPPPRKCDDLSLSLARRCCPGDPEVPAKTLLSPGVVHGSSNPA